MEVNRGNREIDGIINNFEERKLNDLKTILLDFILLQMKYHSKCLEALTASFHDVQNINEKEDYERFQKLLKTHSGSHSARRSASNSARRSLSMESLDRERLVSPLRRNRRLSKSSKNLSSDVNSQSEENLDEDDEDDDDDVTETEGDDEDGQAELDEQDYDDNTEIENEDNERDNAQVIHNCPIFILNA